jgi:hypothetical protein
MRGNHVRWVSCQHGIEHPQVADGGDGVELWKLAADILIKQSWTVDKGWSSRLGAHRVQMKLLRNVQNSFGIGQIFWINNLSDRIWISNLWHGK